MEKAMNISLIYGISAGLSLILVCGYCALVRKKEIWLVCLYFSVLIANLGYFALSISKNLQEALLANRLAYLGNVFLPLFILMTIAKVCCMNWPKKFAGILIGVSTAVFLVVASQGYLDLYYKEITFEVINGAAKLEKVYGPLHGLYSVYIFAYFGIMIGTVCVAVAQKRVACFKHAGLLAVVALLNIAIWLVEQLINWDFEFLSVSYVASELLLLFLYGMIQDYEISIEQKTAPESSAFSEMPDIKQITFDFPDADKLSAREKEVLKGMLEDKKRKEIADELFITENTVKKHISSIFAKLEVTNRNELSEKIKQKQS